MSLSFSRVAQSNEIDLILVVYTSADYDSEREISTMVIDIVHLRIGIALSLITLLFGFGLGGSFGAFEDTIKASLQQSAMAVKDIVYDGDEAAMGKVTSKSWTYMKRAHLHANGLGTSSLVLILLLATVPASTTIRRFVAGALGAGALGYSSFWLFAARRAPAMGSTHDAKESLSWLAVPSAGLCLVGVIAVLVLFANHYFRQAEN